MGYFFSKVTKSLWFNKKTYALIMIETMLAIMILGMGFHVFLSYKEKLNSLGKSSANALHRIQTIVGDGGELPITAEDYEFCKENYNQNGKAKFIYTIGEPATYIGKDVHNNAQIESFWYLFVSEEFYKYYLEAEKYDKDAIYVGAVLRQWIANETTTNPSPELRSSDFFQGKDLRDIKELNSPLTSYHPSPGSQLGSEYFFENLAILPLEEYDNMLSNSTMVEFMIKTDLANLESTAYSVIQYLSKKNPDNAKRNVIMSAGDSQYGLSSETEKFISQNKLLIGNYKITSVYTGMALTIIIFGLGGVLMLLVQRQKQAYAIAIMTGAGGLRLIVEFFIEVLLVMWTSTGIGLLLGAFFLNVDETKLFVISFQPIVIFYCFSITFIISALGCILPSIMMMRLSPAEILRQAE